jgi:hypothetical protein
VKALVRVLVVLALLAGARTASAVDRDVTVVVAGPTEEANALKLVVRDLLVRLGASVDVSSADAVDSSVVLDKPLTFAPALARVWIDLRRDDRATIYLVDGTWDRVLIRRVERDPAHVEVCREEIGHILETAIEAMLAGGKIGVERTVLAPPPIVPRASPPPPRERPREMAPRAPSSSTPVFHAGLTSETGAFANDVFTQAFGVWASLETARNAPACAGGWLTLAYRFPVRETALPVGVELQGLEARLVARLASRVGAHVRLETGAGVGVDVMDASPIATRAGAALAPASADTSFIVRVIAGVRLWDVLGVFVSADVDATRHDFTFTENGSRVVALSPYAVRPAIVLEASFF